MTRIATQMRLGIAAVVAMLAISPRRRAAGARGLRTSERDRARRPEHRSPQRDPHDQNHHHNLGDEPVVAGTTNPLVISDRLPAGLTASSISGATNPPGETNEPETPGGKNSRARPRQR